MKNGLLLTDMQIAFHKQSLHLQRVLVDTGAGGLIMDLAESIGIVPDKYDAFYRISGVGGSEFVYSKKIDSPETKKSMTLIWSIGKMLDC